MGCLYYVSILFLISKRLRILAVNHNLHLYNMDIERFSDLKSQLEKYNIHATDELIKTAILLTDGKKKDIVLFLLQSQTHDVQIDFFKKHRNLLVEYPIETLDPIVVIRLIDFDHRYIKDFTPCVLVKTIRQYPSIANFIKDERMIQEIIKCDPTIVDYVNWEGFITPKLLEELGFHTRFTIDELREDLDDTVGIVVLCHGGAYELGVAPSPMTRMMQIPWGICQVHNNTSFIHMFNKMVARKHLLEDEFMAYPTLFTRKQLESFGSDDLFVRILESTSEMDAPLIHSFEPGDELLLKNFSCSSNDYTYDGFMFLIIKGRTKTFNLFSIKHDWTMPEIFDLIEGRRSVWLDYSCNTMPDGLVPREKLSKVGGKRKTRKSKK